jgi:adenylate cyclase
MPELEARYRPDPSKFWRKTLPAEEVKLGRRPGERVGEVRWAVEWDDFISGLHASLQWRNGKLLVRRRMVPEPTRNPLFFKEQECNEFVVAPGEHFVIGETVFTVLGDPAPGGPDDGEGGPGTTRLLTMSVSKEELRSVQYSDPNKRIEALAALPEVIRNSAGDTELEERVVKTLLDGIPYAEAAAVIMLPPAWTRESPRVPTRAQKCKRGDDIRPSRKLVADALLEKKQSVVHVWSKETAVSADYSMADAGLDWAICTPLPEGPPTAGRFGLYITGRTRQIHLSEDRLRRDQQLRSDLKFCELTAEIFNSLRHVRDLQARQATLKNFFSPAVVDALNRAPNPEELLAAKVTPVTVLFCDIRNSVGLAESSDLPTTWARMREALGIMTKAIVAKDGIIGDFQGDAVMAFWGWPLTQPDQIDRAVSAAVEIRRGFNALKLHDIPAFRVLDCGIGIAHGDAIAGKIGPDEQFKLGAFGPVVNLTARLETMTKQFGVKILVDETIARHLGQQPSAPRCRPLLRVCPKGSTRPLVVTQLLVEGSEDYPSPEDLAEYRLIVDDCHAGRWESAQARLMNKAFPPKKQMRDGREESAHPVHFLEQLFCRIRETTGRLAPPPPKKDGKEPWSDEKGVFFRLDEK